MEKAEKSLTNQGASATGKQPEPPSQIEKIKAQVLAKIGNPPRLDRVEVCQHHNGKYRVNVWQTVQLSETIAISASSRIGLSFYLTVADMGEIIRSDPPMTKAF